MIHPVMNRGDRREAIFQDDVDRQDFLNEHAIAGDTAAGRAAFERRREASRQAEADEAEWAPLRWGWCPGSEAFRQEMPERMEGQPGEPRAGALRRQSAEVRAEHIIPQEPKRQGATETGWMARRKSDPVKLGLAARLRRETTMTIGWIARRRGMGTRKSAAMKLHRWG